MEKLIDRDDLKLIELNVKRLLRSILWFVFAISFLIFLSSRFFKDSYFGSVANQIFTKNVNLFFILVFLTFLLFSEIAKFKNFELFEANSLIISFVSLTLVGISITGGMASPLFIFLIFSLIFSGVIGPFWLTNLFGFLEAGAYLIVVKNCLRNEGIIFSCNHAFIYSFLLILTGLITGYFSEIFKTKNKNLLKTLEQLKKTQSQLIQSEKMASIGILAGGIAHQLRNPITSILGFSDLATKKLEKKSSEVLDDLQSFVKEIYLNSKHCKEIINDLLDFAKTSSNGEIFEKVNVKEVLKSAVKIIKHQLDLQNIIVKEDFPKDEYLVSGIANQLQQVFLNIIINAKDAMPTGGILELSIRKSGEFVQISFKDNGIGMPEEIISRVFEPFFTTKEKDKGIGLGLSVSYGIISRHKGKIEISSKQGAGTVVIVSLPILH